MSNLNFLIKSVEETQDSLSQFITIQIIAQNNKE